MKAICPEKSLDELLRECIDGIGLDVSVRITREPSEKYGYIWCTPGESQIACVPISLHEFAEQEEHFCGSQAAFHFRAIIEMLRNQNVIRAEDQDYCVPYGLFCVLHEIGHMIDCMQDPKGYEERADKQKEDWKRVQRQGRERAAVGFTEENVFSFLSSEYRVLECERAADGFAIGVMQRHL